MPPLKKNEKIMLALIGISVVVFIVLDPYYLWKEKPVTAPPAKPGAAQAAKPGQPATAAKSNDKPAPAGRVQREAIVFENWGRDPFVQARYFTEDDSTIYGLKLGGISVRGDDRYALINSQIVRPGDEIAGMSVLRIERDRVIIGRGSKLYTLTWGQ